MNALCHDLVALVAAADPENGGSGVVRYTDLRALAERAAELMQPRERMEIEIEAIEENLQRRDRDGLKAHPLDVA